MSWLFWALLSALLSALSAVYQKRVLREITPMRFAILLALFNAILTIPFMFSVSSWQLPMLTVAVLFLKTVLNCVAFLFVMRGLFKTEISLGLPLMALTPVLVAVLGTFLLKEFLTLKQSAGMVVVIAGSLFLSYQGKRNISALKNRAIINYLIALFVFAFSTILDKTLFQKFKLNEYDLLVWQHFLSLPFFILIYPLYQKYFKESVVPTATKTDSLKSLCYFFVPLFLMTIFYRLTFLLALKSGPAALVLTSKRISVLFAVIIGGTLFKEGNLFVRIFATLFFLVGGILMVS